MTNRTSRRAGSDILAAGVATFAALLLLMVGVAQVLQGIVALANDGFYVVTRDYTYDVDITAWGWGHIIAGLVALAASIGLFTSQPWARVLAIGIASISVILNFLWIPYYPVWALLIIGFNVLIIWAVATFPADD